MFDMTDCKSGSQHDSRTGFESLAMNTMFIFNLECFFLSVFLFPVFLSLRTFAGYVEKGIIIAHFLHVKLLWTFRLRHVKLSKVTPMFSL